MYIVIWEISSHHASVKTGKAWEKFDSKKEADDRAENLKITSGQAPFFNLSKIEVLEVV